MYQRTPRTKMWFSLAVGLALAVHCGCASQPLRPAFTQIRLGHPPHEDLKLPVGATWTRALWGWRTTLTKPTFDRNCPARDTIVLFFDRDGRVAAKYYESANEDLFLPALWSYGREIRIWELDLDRAVPAASTQPSDKPGKTDCERIAFVCHRLANVSDNNDWSGVGDLLRELDDHHVAIGPHLHYAHTFNDDNFVIAHKLMRHADSPDGHIFTLVTGDEYDASILWWTLCGYVSWAITGKFPG